MVLQAARHPSSRAPIGSVHTERRGCWSDPVSSPDDVLAMLRTGGLCPDCLDFHARSGVETEKLLALAAVVRVLAHRTKKAN
jgi:hypothetical protein